MTIDIKQLGSANLIVVMGMTGVGKTSFINLASNSSLPVEDVPESCTAELQCSQSFEVDGEPFILIDTPGFDDERDEIFTLNRIIEFLAALYLGDKKLSGIIYLHRITDERMGGLAIKTFRLIRALCGSEFLNRLFITTNRWSTVDKRVGKLREDHLKGDNRFFKRALDMNARLMRHDETLESAHTIIREIAKRHPSAMLIQRELIRYHKDLYDTETGKELKSTLEGRVDLYHAEVDTLKRKVEKIDEEHTKERESLKKTQQSEMDELKKMHQNEIKVLKKAHKDMKRLNESSIALIRGVFESLKENISINDSTVQAQDVMHS